ncbi:MAG: keratin associated protein [Labilithrix sp.]|nr:keratin associated protein [Labilithrix sp.]
MDGVPHQAFSTTPRPLPSHTHASARSVALVALAAAFAVTTGACGGRKPAAATEGSGAPVSSRCPDLEKADEVASFDFATEFGLSRDAADKLKAAALATTEMSTLSDKLDAELGIACAQIAHDLGANGDWRSGSEACTAAVKAVHDARARLTSRKGTTASTSLVVRTPVCQVDASLMTKCASICDSSVPAARIKAECELKAGRCDGACDGLCELKNPGHCEGTCSGSCDGPIKGTCGGRCKGTCDGRPASGTGVCAGVCVGTCTGGALAGECKGSCTGSCKAKAPGICEGTCAGSCSVELAEVKCAGETKSPDVSTDCRARCELAVINQTECSIPQVGLLVTGNGREGAEALKAAVDKSFPALLKVLFEVGDKGGKRVLNAQAVIEGARTGFAEMARSGGKATMAASQQQLVKCFDEPFRKASAYATVVKASLDHAQAVRDEVTR